MQKPVAKDEGKRTAPERKMIGVAANSVRQLLSSKDLGEVIQRSQLMIGDIGSNTSGAKIVGED